MTPDFDKDPNGLLPAIVQDANTGKVLMLAYMNRESYELTLKTGKATFYSRSRKQLWLKGETSGHFMMVKQVFLDCDLDTILVKAGRAAGVFTIAVNTGILSRSDLEAAGANLVLDNMLQLKDTLAEMIGKNENDKIKPDTNRYNGRDESRPYN